MIKGVIAFFKPLASWSMTWRRSCRRAWMSIAPLLLTCRSATGLFTAGVHTILSDTLRGDGLGAPAKRAYY
eukprot:7049615-Prorocentrum_lima.AAC.1